MKRRYRRWRYRRSPFYVRWICNFALAVFAFTMLFMIATSAVAMAAKLGRGLIAWLAR